MAQVEQFVVFKIQQQTNLVAGKRKQVKTCSNMKNLNSFKIFGQNFLFFTICAGIQIQPLPPFVVCCCKLNYTPDCDEHLFGPVSTHTGHYQLPIYRVYGIKGI